MLTRWLPLSLQKGVFAIRRRAQNIALSQLEKGDSDAEQNERPKWSNLEAPLRSARMFSHLTDYVLSPQQSNTVRSTRFYHVRGCTIIVYVPTSKLFVIWPVFATPCAMPTIVWSMYISHNGLLLNAAINLRYLLDTAKNLNYLLDTAFDLF